MKTSSMKRFFKLIISFLALSTVIIIFIYMNITFSYPLNNVRLKVIEFKELNGKYPNSLDELKNSPKVKFMSVLEYQNKGDDFLLYFCPTKLGPCEVSNKSKEPFFDEI